MCHLRRHRYPSSRANPSRVFITRTPSQSIADTPSTRECQNTHITRVPLHLVLAVAYAPVSHSYNLMRLSISYLLSHTRSAPPLARTLTHCIRRRDSRSHTDTLWLFPALGAETLAHILTHISLAPGAPTRRRLPAECPTLHTLSPLSLYSLSPLAARRGAQRKSPVGHSAGRRRRVGAPGAREMCVSMWARVSAPNYRKVDIRLHGKGNSNSHGARPVHQKHLRHDEVDPDKLVVNK